MKKAVQTTIAELNARKASFGSVSETVVCPTKQDSPPAACCVAAACCAAACCAAACCAAACCCAICNC